MRRACAHVPYSLSIYIGTFARDKQRVARRLESSSAKLKNAKRMAKKLAIRKAKGETRGTTTTILPARAHPFAALQCLATGRRRNRGEGERGREKATS